MLQGRLYFRQQPEVFEYELDNFNDQDHCGKQKNGFGGGDEEVLLSDDDNNTADTGFSSQAESATEVETEDDGYCEVGFNDRTWDASERRERAQLRYYVNANYNELWKKYTTLNIAQMDPFSGVHFWEMCMVLELSSKRSGLVESVQLLDLVLQLFSRQVRLCDSCIKTLAEDIGRLNKRRKERHEGIELRVDSNAGPATTSQRHKGPAVEADEESDSDWQQQAMNRNKTICRRKKSHIVSDETQLTYDFLKEHTAHIFARRVKLHNHCTQIIQDPFLDYTFDLAEYYDNTNEMENDSRRLRQSCTRFLTDMQKFTRRQDMCSVYIPPVLLNDLESADDLDEEEHEIPMEVNTLALQGQCEIPNDAENVAPANGTQAEGAIQQQENIPHSEITAGGIENIVQDEKGNKGRKGNKKKRKRVPFLDKQNLREPMGEGEDAKRARLEEGAEIPQSQSSEIGIGQECLRNVEQCNQFPADGCAIPHVLNEKYGIEEESYNPEISDNYDGGSLTDAEGGGSFRPPSPLHNSDSSRLEFQTRTTRVNMSAIKSKFKDIVHESQMNHEEVTFVEILQRSDLEIYVGPNETILPSSSTTFSSSGEVSVGVAFLAMLHNAASANLYLLEDVEGGFKVTNEKPQDVTSDEL